MALLSILLIASVPMTQGSPLDGNEVPTCSGVGDNGKCGKNDEHVSLLQSVVNVHTHANEHAQMQVQNGMEGLGEMEDEDEVQGPANWEDVQQTCHKRIKQAARVCQKNMQEKKSKGITKWCGRLKSMCPVCEALCTDDPSGNSIACGRKSDYCITSTQNWLPSCQGGGPTGTAFDMVSDGTVEKGNKCKEGFAKCKYGQNATARSISNSPRFAMDPRKKSALPRALQTSGVPTSSMYLGVMASAACIRTASLRKVDGMRARSSSRHKLPLQRRRILIIAQKPAENHDRRRFLRLPRTGSMSHRF